MKPRFSLQRNQALTLFEVGVIIAVMMIAAALLLPVISNARRPQAITCVSNLKQVGIAFRLWEGDNNDKYPMAVSVTNGGAMELIATGNVAACFQLMSNELSTPKILHCPEDTRRLAAMFFSPGFNNSNVSYFVGLDAVEIHPQMILDGDDHLTVAGASVRPGILNLWTNAAVAWAPVRHHGTGNIGLADGSVQSVTDSELAGDLIQTGVATNRFALP